jgi:cytochrome c oxidase subunit 2
LGLALIAVAASGCKGQWSRLGWPAPVTKEGQHTLGVWYGSLVTAGVVGAFTIALILWAAIHYRRRDPDQLPRQVRYNLPIEVLYTMIPIVIVSVLFYFTAINDNDEDNFKVPPKLSVEVVGFQWSWQFNYLADKLSITGAVGSPPQLVLPINEPIRFYEVSPDVIHAWWVIPFLFKRDVVPGLVNTFQLTITKTGTFQGKCTEYCGINHDRMLFSVKAVTPAQFATWLSQTQALAASNVDPRYSVYTGPANVTVSNATRIQRSHQ